MTILDLVLVAAALPCALVAGFLFAFAMLVMPGLRSLGRRGLHPWLPGDPRKNRYSRAIHWDGLSRGRLVRELGRASLDKATAT